MQILIFAATFMFCLSIMPNVNAIDVESYLNNQSNVLDKTVDAPGEPEPINTETKQDNNEKTTHHAIRKEDDSKRLSSSELIEKQPEFSRYIFVGDSRTVGMRTALYGYVDSEGPYVDEKNNVWICEGGIGLYWMKDHTDEITNAITENSCVVINMGTNDAYSYESQGYYYADYLNEHVDDWINRGATVCFMSTNPVSDSGAANWTGLRNRHVVKFNEIVKNNIDKRIHYIDSYNYLQETGWMAPSTDGVHYYDETYISIFNYVTGNTWYSSTSITQG